MKKPVFIAALFFLISVLVFSGTANAYWIWTPETKKFINPKYAVKDSPKEQFSWAMSFYDAKDFQRAATEFEKLAKQYEFSEYASKSQYYVGLCYENMNKYYLAYQNYQKAIDNFPHVENTEEILAREFAIANLYLSKPSPKILGTDIMAPLDRAVEIFKKIVENAPYGKFAEESQFNLGEALKKSERYEEAVQAFHKLVEDYPKSKLATKAMYEESNCAYRASLKPAYDAAATDNAIKTFEKFVQSNKDSDLAKNASSTIKKLKDNVSEKSFRAAEFYEARGKIRAAIIYYQDVVDTYPNSTFADSAKAKIEALKAREAKKAAVSADLSKKKPEQVVREKKAWSPFKFKSEKPGKKAETSVPEISEKKSWKPLSFNSGKKKSSLAVQAAPVKEAPKKTLWNLFNFGAKEKSAIKKTSNASGVKTAETPRSETPKRGWKPLNFNTINDAEPKKVPETSATTPAPVTRIEEEKAITPAIEASKPEPVNQIAQNPDQSGSTTQTVETSKQPVAETIAAETPKKRSWVPLNFDTKKEPIIKEAHKNKGWKPLYFGTNDEPMAATNRRW